MNRAIIYTRVSTDEQADKGYSLRDQEDRLRKYCTLKQIEVVAHFKDDHSAKTFDRPGFHQLLHFLKSNKNNVDLLLFLKWDRFSRNAGDSYAMIKKLTKYNIEPQAIEQPLDLNIPENKMMLAFYLAAPEVENDRRSLNVSQGMRRAKLEGRWIAMAPKGYRNRRDENNKPIIQPDENAKFVKRAFEDISKGIYQQEEVRRNLRKEGFICSKNQFSVLLRHPVYIGKIQVPAYRDEPEQIVDGIHEPIITEALFYKVQDVLNNKKRKLPSGYKRREALPLRGYLKCSCCDTTMTGSGSIGNGGKYYYYHGTRPCKARYRADKINSDFTQLMSEIKVDKDITKLYYDIIKEKLKEQESTTQVNSRKADHQIEKLEMRIRNLQDRFADQEITVTDFSEIKKRYSDELNTLMLKKSENTSRKTEYMKYVKEGFPLLHNIDKHYENADLTTKQQIISSIFPEKLTYTKSGFRTTRVNEVVAMLSAENKQFLKTKKGLTSKIAPQSFNVNPQGFEPRTC